MYDHNPLALPLERSYFLRGIETLCSHFTRLSEGRTFSAELLSNGYGLAQNA